MQEPKKSGCLVCGREDQRLRRGLCVVHYTSFRNKLDGLQTEEEKRLFEEYATKQGWLKAKKPPGKPRQSDPFDVIAEQVVKESRPAEFGKAELNANHDN